MHRVQELSPTPSMTRNLFINLSGREKLETPEQHINGKGTSNRERNAVEPGLNDPVLNCIKCFTILIVTAKVEH